MNKPVHVTEKQNEVMAAMLEHGTAKLAARALGMSHRTVEVHVRRLKGSIEYAMGRRLTMVQLAVWWDRQRRAA